MLEVLVEFIPDFLDGSVLNPSLRPLLENSPSSSSAKFTLLESVGERSFVSALVSSPRNLEVSRVGLSSIFEFY